MRLVGPLRIVRSTFRIRSFRIIFVGVTVATSPTPESFSPLPEGVYCPRCAFDLRAAAGARCPECGHDLGGLRSADCAIPWSHRARLGRVRAYFETMWMATFRHRRFCEEYARTASYTDARRFQFVTVALAFLPIVAGVIFVYWHFPPDLTTKSFEEMVISGNFQPGPAYGQQVYAAIWPVAVLLGCLLLLLILATGMPSYFFHPKYVSVARQNSAIALSYYTCGPLALLGLIPALLSAAHLVDHTSHLRSLFAAGGLAELKLH